MESQPKIDLSGNTNRSRPAKGTGQVGNFRSVEEVDSKYRDVFTYQYFNLVQSGVLDDGLYSDKSMVVCAPTGSGKTVIFEMAIIQLLMDMESKQCNDDFKIIYMAPVKALCTERLTEWYSKFTKLGLLCIEVTGDTNVDLSQLKPYKIIITTPEKWDMMTRRWRDHRGLVEIVKLFLIDEVHILNDEVRGPVLEAVVSRMKTIESAAQSAHRIEKLQKQYQSNSEGDKTSPSSKSTAPPRIRFVAVSATVSNPQDVAAWLGNENKSAVYYKFGDECRPVKIKRVVEGYPCPDGTSIFKFDIILNYKLWPVIQKYHDGKPTLIFCNTRKSVQMTAEALSREITITFNAEQRAKLTALASTIKTKKLQSLVLAGVGCHHAGMLYEERVNIEHAFRDRQLPILITTTTLAMGVNLPAHLVIIKNTQQYVNGAFQEYGISMVLQMLGRAGRPQFDTDATAVIMTRQRDKARYQALVEGTEPLQSYLHKRLAENLNSEAALGTVGDVAQCVQWLRSTFLYVRAAKDPKRYLSLPPAAPSYQISKKIEEMCVRAMNGLASAGLITMDEASCIASTEAGRLMSVYYLDLETMKLLMKIQGDESLERLLCMLCECHELADMHLRVDERRSLNALNRNNTAATIRFPMKGKINSRQMKVNCIIQAVLGCLPIPDPSLNQEAMKIMRIATRICKCLLAYVTRPEIKSEEQTYFSAILNSIILCKCMEAGLWETSSYVSKQLKGIGPTYSTLLATAGKVNFMLLEESHPRDLERIMNKGPPAGNVLRKQISLLPKYQIEATPVNEKTVSVQLLLLNHMHLSENVDQLTAGEGHRCYVVAGDSKNHVMLLNTFKDKDLISVYNGTMTYEITRRHNFEHKVYIHCISSTFVGIDAHCEYTFKNLIPSVPNDINSSSAYFTDTETPKRQQTKNVCPKKRKNNSTDDIAQSKEKKKRENALAEKFRLLKESFSKTSDKMKNNLQEVDKISKSALNDLFQIDNSNLVNNINKCVAEKDSIPEMFDEICELENDGVCDDFEDIMDSDKIDSILNSIENEILIINKDTVASKETATCQNNISKEIGNRVETLTIRNSRKNKHARTESNYKFIELLERNVDLSEEDEIPINDNGFSEAIKSRLDKYLETVRVKEDVTSDPTLKELCREPGFKPEQSSEKANVSIHKNLTQSRLSCKFDDKDINLYKRPQKCDETNKTRTTNTFVENSLTVTAALNKLSSDQSNQLALSNEKVSLCLNENNRESHACHEVDDIENDMFEYPQKFDKINYSTTIDIKSDKIEPTNTLKEFCIVSNQNRAVRKYDNEPQSHFCYELDNVHIDVYKPLKEYDNVHNTETSNFDACLINSKNKTMNAMLKDIYRRQGITQLGMQKNISQLFFNEKVNNGNTYIEDYKSSQYLTYKGKAIVADANIKNSINVITTKPFKTAIAEGNLSIGSMISEQESSKPITIQISQNFGEPLKENRNYRENSKSYNQQNSLMLHPNTGNALQIVSTDELKCDNIIQNNDTIKDIDKGKYNGDKAIQNNETNLIIMKQKQSNSFASSNKNSFESTNSQLRQENYNSHKNSITPEIASFGEADSTILYSRKEKDDEYYQGNQSAKQQFPEPYLSSHRNRSDHEYSSVNAPQTKTHEVKYAFSAEKVDVQSKFTNEHQIRYIRKLKVDLDVTEIIFEEKRASPFNFANSANKEDLSNVVEGDTLKHHSLKFINRSEKTTLTKNINNNKKDASKENADDQDINRTFFNQSENKEETLGIHHNVGYNNNFKNNNNVENILQKYSKKLSKGGKCVKTPIIQNTYKDNCKNLKSIKSNKPFKITDIQNLKIPLSNLCDPPKIPNNLRVRGQMTSKVTERNATSESSFIANPDGKILTENPNGYKDIYKEEGCSEYNLTPLPLDTADNLSQHEINIDHSMLDPKALLKCFENDESNNMELIPPPPEFCDQRGVYSPELGDDLDTDLFTHDNFQEDPRFNNDNAPYINSFNIVKDNIDKINMLPPSEETETWTLSQNDVEIDSFSQNPVPPYTTFYRMNLQNNTNQLISNSVPAYIPREKNLNQFKYNRKIKPKIKL